MNPLSLLRPERSCAIAPVHVRERIGNCSEGAGHGTACNAVTGVVCSGRPTDSSRALLRELSAQVRGLATSRRSKKSKDLGRAAQARLEDGPVVGRALGCCSGPEGRCRLPDRSNYPYAAMGSYCCGCDASTVSPQPPQDKRFSWKPIERVRALLAASALAAADRGGPGILTCWARKVVHREYSFDIHATATIGRQYTHGGSTKRARREDASCKMFRAVSGVRIHVGPPIRSRRCRLSSLARPPGEGTFRQSSGGRGHGRDGRRAA